jgi:membrane protein DedA with SNARE-associated domain
MFHTILVYFGLFLGVFLEGEFVLLSAVIAAHHGYLDIWVVVSIGILATISSDLFYFNIGRNKVSHLINNNKWANTFIGIKKKFENHRIQTLLGYRFLYGFRTVTPIFLGTQNISFKEFLKFSVIGTIVWASIITGLGILFGELLIVYMKDLEKVELYVIGFLLTIAVISILIRLRKKSKIK